MTNKRTLKKAINMICEELFAEGVAISLYGPRPKKDVEALLLRENFSAQVGEITDQLNS